MTVATTACAVTHQGNGVTKDWPFLFEIPKNEIKVTLIIVGVPTPPIVGSYTVTGFDNPNGGSVKYPNGEGAPALAAGDYIIIERVTPYTQTMNLVNQGNFNAESLEDGLDRLEFQIQQLKGLLDINNANFDRTLRVPIPEKVVEFPVYTQRSLKFPFFDIVGQPALVESGIENIVWSLANFESRAALAASRPNPAVSKVVFVAGYATYGDGGHGWYKYEPGGSTWPDGEVVDLDGKVWRLILEHNCLYAEQLGVVADAPSDGRSGTINNDAIRRVIASPAGVVIWPHGGIRYDQTIRMRPDQTWIGMGGEKGDNQTPSATEFTHRGTAFFYVGTGNRYAMESDPAVLWQRSVIRGINFATGFEPMDPNSPDPEHPTPIPDTVGRDCEWLFQIHHGLNTDWEDVSFRHRGGQRQLPAMAVGSFGCLRVQNKIINPETGKPYNSWVHNFRKVEFGTGCNRRDSEGDTMLYNGYGWGFDCAGNDIYMTDCHFNGASLIGRNAGGWHISNTNFENGDWGSEPGFDGNPTGRAAICSVVGAGGNRRGVSGVIIGGTISQYSYAFHTDASGIEGNIQCSIRVVGTGLRRNRLAEFRWVQNVNNGASGGQIINVGCTQKDEDEPEDEGPGDLVNPGLGKGAPPRHEIIYADGSPADWPGMRMLNNSQYFPDAWDTTQGMTAAWHPRFFDTSGGRTDDPNPPATPPDPNDWIPDWNPPIQWRGVQPKWTTTGGATLVAPEKVTSAKFADGFPTITIKSGTADNSVAEFWGDRAVCVRGTVGFGGFFIRFRWALGVDLAGNPIKGPDDRGFIGITSSHNPIAVTTPTALVQSVGVGFGPGQTNWHLISAGATLDNDIDLGSNFPNNVGDAVYQMSIMATSAGKIWFVRVDRLDAPVHTLQTTLKNAEGPATHQVLYPHLWRHNGTSGGAATSTKLILMECYTQPTQWHGGSVFAGPQIWVP